MKSTSILSLGVALASLGACKTGDPGVRNDIIAKMNSIKEPLDGCYAMALARNRQTPGGMVTVEFIAEAQTGQFKNVLIRRNEVQDPAVTMCVIQEVSRLKLTQPPQSNMQIPYAFRFTPL